MNSAALRLDRSARSDRHEWPARPAARTVVLHTRVVTETGGGPDKTIMLSAAALASTRYWVAAAYMYPPGDPGFSTLRQRAAAAGSPLIGVRDNGPLDLGVARELLALSRQLGVRIWHGHDYKSNLLGLVLRRLHPMVLVTNLHGWVKHTRRTPLYYAVDRWCLARYDRVICVSDDLGARVRKLGIPGERCSVIYNGVDDSTFHRRCEPTRSALRTASGVATGRLVVGAAGRLSPEKGFAELIEATALLAGRGLDFEVWIAGAGEQRAELRRLIDARGLARYVRLLGFTDHMLDFYEALDAFVLSSREEGLPNVLLEAMAMGVPVVATTAGGVSRVVEHGQTGLLCPTTDIDALAGELGRLLTEPTLRATLASTARQHVAQHFSFTRRMASVRAVYDQVLAPSTARRGGSLWRPRPR